VTTGTLHELSGHNAIESGTIYKLTNWTIPGGPQAYAVVGWWLRPGGSRCGFNQSTSKRRKGYPSETKVRRGGRVVHADKELIEKLGRNDLCPCGSGKRFKRCCLRL